MLHRSDMYRSAIIKRLSVLVLSTLILCLSSCKVQPAQTFPVETTGVTEPTVPATPDTATRDFATVAARPTTVRATEYIFRGERSDPSDPYDATGFVSVGDVIPDVILDIRYYSGNNFVGDRIDGYEEPLALLSEEAARALKSAADQLREQGYRLKIFDAYRPQRAVSHFASWANDRDDTRNKDDYYPNLDKSVLIDYGYIAYYSGHCRGSKVDLTLTDQKGKELDMGGTFDYFDTLSHPDYTGITEEQYANRMLLREAMLDNGFYPCDTEWWDFTLYDEPYPDTSFDFPVSSVSLTYK